MTITAQLFVQNSGEQSGRPGHVNRVVRLQGVSAKESVDNAKLFEPGENGNISMDLSGLTEEMAAAFKGGKAVKVTFETA